MIQITKYFAILNIAKRNCMYHKLKITSKIVSINRNHAIIVSIGKEPK